MFKFLLSLILFATPSHAAVSEADKALIFSKNILTNGGFEPDRGNNNRITNGWTASGGTFSAVTSGANLLVGKGSVTWDSSAASQTLTSNSVVIDKGNYGRNGAASCLIQVPSGTITHKLQVYDGSVVINEIDITSSAAPFRNSVNFIFPSSGSISIRIISVASDESLIAIDDCYLGPSEGYNTSSVSQATFVGSAYIATTAACNPARTNTALGAFTADTDCPGPTVVSNPGPGTIQTTDADLPQFTVNNLPPGQYRVVMRTGFTQSAGVGCNAAISDGTTTSQANQFDGTTTTKPGVTIEGEFTYTSAGNRTFQLYGACSSGSLTVQNNAELETTNFAIYKYPLSSEQAYTPDLQAMSWSGYFDNTCSFSRTNTAYGDASDASCALVERTSRNFPSVTSNASTNIGINFTPKKTGRYLVSAMPLMSSAADNGVRCAQLIDGASTVISQGCTAGNASSPKSTIPVTGVYVVNNLSSVTLSLQISSSTGAAVIGAFGSATSAVEWSIVYIDQSLPSPVLTNSIVSSDSGGRRHNSVLVTDGAGTTTISQESGDWINGVCTNGATGSYVCTFNSGIFSSTPNCWVQASGSNVITSVTTTASAATMSFIARTDAVTAADSGFFLFCDGPR